MTTRDRAFFEAQERQALAPYAMRSENSRGREYPEPEHPLRPAFQRDRDRIIHSSAFRRLEYKTQVFVNHEGDYYRTRLTHTMECAQITRTVAGTLGLNRDLAEAVALAHDLGHTPFGHAGEHVLDDLMKDYGGFDHNSQSLRIVEVLEQRYPQFDGLNLTYEVREGIVKHSGRFDRPRVSDFDASSAPPLEAQIVDYCDEVAYNGHDIDDGIQSGLITLEDLDGVELWDEAFAEVRRLWPSASFSVLRYQAVRLLIDRMVRDLIEAIEGRIQGLGIETIEDLRRSLPPIAEPSPEMGAKVRQLKARLMDRLYQHRRVRRMGAKALRVMRGLFEAYMIDPRQMPLHICERAVGDTTMPRVIADYIAGMTDRFAFEEYAKLFDPFEKV
ncbi:MAG TPA: deoxyguanosinetriphosphate triphosphohydrolase [Candidatus Limnocylindrales bacterium]|nr:deoxyguanosinetriphosphate triphosphohydrolase [Candidatus Limnocylindrales bacterium]